MTQSGKTDSSLKDKPPKRIAVLLVEPDRLTRWSVQEYLKHRFELKVAENAEVAFGLLAGEAFDAVIVANDLPDDGADRVEQCARAKNDQLLVVRTITSSGSDNNHDQPTVFLEKPFDLSALVRVLVESTDAKTMNDQKGLMGSQKGLTGIKTQKDDECS